jgi:hypothetical protein
MHSDVHEAQNAQSYQPDPVDDAESYEELVGLGERRPVEKRGVQGWLIHIFVAF